MTPTEFKAWFDGYTEAIGGTPSDAQWERIKERVREMNMAVLTSPSPYPGLPGTPGIVRYAAGSTYNKASDMAAT